MLRRKRGKAEVPAKEGSRYAENGKSPAEDNIWVEADWAIAADMDPQVARLLSQRRSRDGCVDGNTVKVWLLSYQNNVRDALNGRTGAARYLRVRPAITFAPAAVKRMELRLGPETPKTAVMEFGEVRALGFRTGQGLLVTEIHIRSGAHSDAVAMPVLVESLVALCSDRQMNWHSEGVNLTDEGKRQGLSLRDMLRTLLGDYAENAMTTARVFTYTFAKLDSIIDPVERQRLMIQLACKYTYDYRFDPAAFDERVYQPFESVCIWPLSKAPSPSSRMCRSRIGRERASSRTSAPTRSSGATSPWSSSRITPSLCY